MALVERAKRECSPVYASIFLNPKQFGPKEDLSKYRGPLRPTRRSSKAAKIDGLFLPDAARCTRQGFATMCKWKGSSERLEGKSRRGIFAG